MSAPRATYRLQLRAGVTLRDARQLVGYLERLGVSHAYLSPIFCARRGSTHGYDVVDPRTVDPSLGGEAALSALARALQRHGLGAVLDIVPNHLAVGAENPFFDDLLAHGPASRFANWFDVDWGQRRRGHAPLVLPVLGADVARCIARGELELEAARGAVRVRYFERSFPLDPRSLPALLVGARRTLPSGRARAELEALLAALAAMPARDAPAARRAVAPGLERELARWLRGAGARRAVEAACRSFTWGVSGRARLQRLLEEQAYRLMEWRRGSRVLNYRRFFDISDLIGVRADDPAVFAATHAAALAWIERGWIDGLRVDHVDGIADPDAYLEQLRAGVDAAGGKGARPCIWVEKILAADESLPARWPVEGSTGYEFLNQLEALFLEPRGVRAIEAAWTHGRSGRGFEATAHAAKRSALTRLLSADLGRLGRQLDGLLVEGGERRVPQPELRRALVEVATALSVYRVYPRAGGLAVSERRRLEQAFARARHARRASARALAALERALLGPARGAPARLAFQQRFQQLTAPAAAKGVEDTALYRFLPLLSRNEVGSEPAAPPRRAASELHRRNAERARRWPLALLGVTTHDTKRSADLRARLDVLSEIPDAWLAAVARWRRWNAPLRIRAGRRRLPDADTEYLLYQTLVGAWPLAEPARADAPLERVASPEFRQRIEAYLLKASREARRQTSWTRPDAAFEAALGRFIGSILASGSDSPAAAFTRDLVAFTEAIARSGLWNALSRTLVQLTAPGIPDLYQGDELWNFSLVDPDNRRPVDFARRRRLLGQVERGFAAPSARRREFLRRLVECPEDGRVKLHVIRTALAARRAHPGLFEQGRYTPVAVAGRHRDHVFAFARSLGRRVAVVAVTRLPHALGSDPVGEAVWGDTRLVLADSPRRRWRCALTQTSGAASARGELPLGGAFAQLPVCLLMGDQAAGQVALRERDLDPLGAEGAVDLHVERVDELDVVRDVRTEGAEHEVERAVAEAAKQRHGRRLGECMRVLRGDFAQHAAGLLGVRSIGKTSCVLARPVSR